jgi:hypothetical protein
LRSSSDFAAERASPSYRICREEDVGLLLAVGTALMFS